MEGSLAKEEEETVTSILYHPCNFLEQAFRALFRCLGVECGTKMGSQTKEEKSSLLLNHHPSGADPIITPENTASYSMKTSQEDADPPPSTNGSLMERRGPRRSDLSQGNLMQLQWLGVVLDFQDLITQGPGPQ